MAEGFARARNRPGVEALSAGTEATAVNPVAVRVMAEVGVDISGQKSKAIAALGAVEVDVVVTLCAKAAAACPMFPGNPQRVHWDLPDPAAVAGDERTVLAAFRGARDRIRQLVDDLFDRGYLDALAAAKRSADLILDHISDAVVAHDMNRRVFHFNKAAEQITGYRREEVMGRDCHDVFPGNLCGGKCIFCEVPVPEFDVRRSELQIATRSGERRVADATAKALRDPEGRRAGVLLSFRDITREQALARRAGEMEQFSGIVGRDKKMLELFDLIRDVAETSAPVLVQGDSGTGKELVAAAIHNLSPRANRQFVPVNCGALPESLLESELFGHVKGAFTGAIRDKKGRFELADGGTIFLDEVGDITPAMQVKLMRVLQEGTFERVGSERTVKVDVRVISATNRNLSDEIDKGRFREDLYYRLSVVPMSLPPLRERRNDIPLLADHVLRRALKEAGREGVSLAPETLDLMMSYDWPGNVRELQNWMQFALIKCRGPVIRPEHLPPPRGGAAPARPGHRRRSLTAEMVRDALAQTGGNKVEAARLLRVSRATVYRFLDGGGVSG
jgi:PAS domain S-box-containing protein